jgi:hypothetical protein
MFKGQHLSLEPIPNTQCASPKFIIYFHAFSILCHTSTPVCLSVCLSIYLSIYGSTAPCEPWPLFSFLIYTQSIGLLRRGISPSQDRYLHTEKQKQNKRTQTSHASSEIRTHNPSVRVGEHGSRLRPRSHCERRKSTPQLRIKSQCVIQIRTQFPPS